MQSLIEGSFNQDLIDNGMCLIPAGNFLMGSDGWGEFESPVHEVFVDNFLIDETHVTNAQFAQFVKKTGHKTAAEINGFANGYNEGKLIPIAGLNWRTFYLEERAEHPVILVSWYDANAFASWAGKRLPTEAEFEKAARGGLLQSLYPWGNAEPKNANTCNFGKQIIDFLPTTQVKKYFPNAYGLYDMAGNVWNWCADWFYEESYSKNVLEINKESIVKVRRGASFNIIQTFRLRCANRGAYLPDNYAINIGFRCAKDLKNE